MAIGRQTCSTDEHFEVGMAIPGGPLHKIATVRRQKNVSIQDVAHSMGISESEARLQETGKVELRLSHLYAWHHALNVPITDLLLDPASPLPSPVLKPSRLLQMMQAVTTIHNQDPSERTQVLAETLINQLVEIMPELEELRPESSWPLD